VPREGQLSVRGEDTQSVVGAAGSRSQQKRRLRQVGPGRERLHGRVVKALAVDHYRHRVPAAGLLPEDVHLGKSSSAGRRRPLAYRYLAERVTRVFVVEQRLGVAPEVGAVPVELVACQPVDGGPAALLADLVVGLGGAQQLVAHQLGEHIEGDAGG